MVETAKRERSPKSIALLGNAADIEPELIRKGVIPDIVTDQTSAHDPLNGYYPAGLSKEEADGLRKSDPKLYMRRASDSMVEHVKAIVEMSQAGAVAFEYGNNLRPQACAVGCKEE